MALRRYHNDLIAFPGPNRTNVFYPNTYRDYRVLPYHGRFYDYGGRRAGEDREYRKRRLSDLKDDSLTDHGDLGWPLDYATAWCYKFLLGNQTHIADVIDRIRGLEDVEQNTPYVIFDLLDKALFGGKLKGMVHLRWKAQANCSCGRTSAPGTITGIARICIELNSVPFEEGGVDDHIDTLLDCLIHQMIHAFFLVCCGAQPKGAQVDGRLTDGLHFGVILLTIRSISSKQCQDGVLPLIFHAYARRRLQDPGAQYLSSRRRRGRKGDFFIAVNTSGSSITSPPADGQSHCSHDNRRILKSAIKNWQVEKYSLSLDLNSEERGDVIHDLGRDNELVPTDRLKGPPSSTYVELIWENKRIMIQREKSLKFASLKKPIERQGKMELKVPNCSMRVLRCLYDFLQRGFYVEDPTETMLKHAPRPVKGPPILVSGKVINGDACCGMLDHILVFKTAESMKFEELQEYALRRLYDMPTTSDDPILTLEELYNEGKDRGKPIHAELHKWARKFLARTDNVIPSYDYFRHRIGHMVRGTSNYEKILHMWRDKFEELYHQNLALKDDCKIVWAELTNPAIPDNQIPGTGDIPSGMPGTLMHSMGRRVLPGRRYWEDADLIDCSRRISDWPHISPNYTPVPTPTESVAGDSIDDMGIGRALGGSNLIECTDWAYPSRMAPVSANTVADAPL